MMAEMSLPVHQKPVQQKKDPYKRLAEINRAITTSLDFDRVLNLIVENAAQLVDASACLLLLADSEQHMGIRASLGVDKNRALSFSGDMEEDLIKSLDKLLPPEIFGPMTSVPIIAKRALNGVLVIAREGLLNEEEKWQLSALADQAAIALRNARLYEMELAEANRKRELLASIVASSDDAIMSKDLNGNINSWNRGAERVFGYTADEVIGKPATILMPEDLYDEESEILARIRSGRSIDHYETVGKHKDGTLIDISMSISPLRDEYGKIVGASKIARDITEEKRADEEIARLLERECLAREEAEAANRLKDEFLATLSHELRNPLNVVIGYSELLRRTEDLNNSAFVSRAADVIRRNALAQSQLVSDLLDLSRLQMGKLAINQHPVSLLTIITDAIETVKADAEVKNISLKLNASTDPFMVDGDPVRLGQIAWNLLNNAVKFTPAGGEITITLSEKDEGAQFSIEDTGQGIAPEFLPHVFEIFRQGDASSSRRQGGLGIGLALVKQLVELHGGLVRAESEGVGRGAKLSVWLPLRESEAAAITKTTKLATGALDGACILVVDDSIETTAMLSKLLEMDGAEVHTAHGGVEALALADKSGFDLVISDISMPEMDGYQLLRSLRQRPRMANVPALALTGFGRVSDVDRARQEGFVEHFTKPLDIDKLLNSVRELTRHNRLS
jgi:two-component system CheB/CheR fusion protein